GVIVTEDGVLRIPEDVPIWLDAEAFEQALAEARKLTDPLTVLETADALYLGDYLPDDPYEDWAQQRRTALRRAWCDLQIDLASGREAHGDPAGAMRALNRLLEAEPCDERAAQALITLYGRLGRRSDVELTYRRFVQALDSQLQCA